VELHAGNQGMAKMKSVARSFFWWPGMDTEIEGLAKKCELFLQTCGLPPVAPPIAGQMLLVLIDAHTKWLEVFPVSAATSSETIHQLRTTFARFGLPHTVVTDNGSCFTSEKFGIFLTKNGVRYVKTAPYYPSSNGLAERAVQVFKNGFKKLKDGTIFGSLGQISLFIQVHSAQHYWSTSSQCSEPLHQV